MKLSDCPHPVGTPEHNAWVRTVFIPSEGQRGRYAEDAVRYGARAQGRKLIRDHRRITYTFQIDTAPFKQAADEFREAMVQVAAVTATSVQEILAFIEACRPNPTLRIIASQRRRRHH